MPKILVISAVPREALDATFEKEDVSGVIEGIHEKPRDVRPDELVQLIKDLL
jgi:hypothetical protein